MSATGFALCVAAAIFIVAKCDVGPDTVRMLLYDENHRDAPLQLDSNSLGQAGIDVNKKFKVICHGSSENRNVAWYRPMIDAYLAKGFNVIAIDWSALSNNRIGVEEAKEIGTYIANFFTNMDNVLGIPMSNYHLIGHGVGAHICGYAGKAVKQNLNQLFGRITALDPTGLNVNIFFPNKGLAKGDAKFVDAVHSNLGVEGLVHGIGDADFFPNGGFQQPACTSQPECSNNIAATYFTESINSDNFVSRKCSTYLLYDSGTCKGNQQTVMGENTDQNATGKFYLQTNNYAPYGKGQTANL